MTMSQKNILDAKTNDLELIEFYIDEIGKDGNPYRGYYGMNVAKVLEIIRQPTVTSMPNKHHPAALGTFNLRGRVLPLVDLAVWLKKKMVPGETLKVIVSEYSGVVTAFLVSGVNRIHRLSWNQVEPPGRHVQSYSAQSVTGVVRIENRILFILDMEQLIAGLNPSLDMGKIIEQAADDDFRVDDAQRFNILVADDSQAIRSIISRTLERAGYRVTTASSGKDAWDILDEYRARSESAHVPVHEYVDVVISDIEMPEMDGHALTRKIKGDSVLKQLPVVLFSSLITENMKEKGAKAGADYQVSKPDLPNLTRQIRSIIAQAHGK
jgi:two-component system chemotaxis response regulator CheV